MALEDYSPTDRHLSGRAHAASWLILAALFLVIALAAPITGSPIDTMLANVPETEECPDCGPHATAEQRETSPANHAICLEHLVGMMSEKQA